MTDNDSNDPNNNVVKINEGKEQAHIPPPYSPSTIPPIQSIKPLPLEKIHITNEETTSETQQKNSSFSKKLFILLLTSVLLLGVISFSVYYYGNTIANQSNHIQTPTLIPSPTVVPTNTPTPEPLQNSFSNDQPAFSLQYPQSSQLATESATSISLTFIGEQQKNLPEQPTNIVDGYKITINWNQPQQSIDQALQSLLDTFKSNCEPQSTYSQIQTTTLAGRTAEYYDITNCKNVDYRLYEVSDGQMFYSIQIMYAGIAQDKINYENNVKNILSSFSFTKQESSCNSNADCPNGETCQVIGPIPANQPPNKMCVAPGQVVPM